jgi:hypothetical protein
MTEPKPIVFANQLDAQLIAALSLLPQEYSELHRVLVAGLPVAVQFMTETIASDSSTPENRTRAANTLFWLFSICTKFEATKSRQEAKTQAAVAKRVKADALKKRAEADKTRAEITIRDEQKRARAAARKALKGI